MEREPNQPLDSPLLPDDALPCVWMTAGLVSYKLCDRDYDCEHCSFDTALQGGNIESQLPQTRGIQPARWEFPSDRLYHRSHAWIRAVNGAQVRYGLDIFAGRLLDRVTSVVLPSVQSRLERGRPACWVKDENELIPLRSPITGTVTQVNGKVQHYPSLITTSPYDDGWLLEALCETTPDRQGNLRSAEEQQRETTLQLQKLHQRILHDLPVNADVGPTLADGGEPITDLRRMLGPRRYHRLILQFIG